MKQPAPAAEAAIIATGAILPEAIAAWDDLQDDLPGLGLMVITLPDLLHRGWSGARAARWRGGNKGVRTLPGCLPRCRRLRASLP